MKYFTSLEWLLQQVPAQPKSFGISVGLGVIMNFLLQRWESDFILLPFTFLLIIINTVSGVRRAKKEGSFNKSILRVKTTDKMVGYGLWLAAMYIIGISLSTIVDKAETVLIPKEWIKIAIHYPITLSYFFIDGVEINSLRQNIKSFGVQTPDFIADKIEKLTTTGKIKPNE